jgi:arabinogalactan endo-1,4-beta-galactosidase
MHNQHAGYGEKYGKEVMICEVGMDNSAAQTAKTMLSELLQKVKSLNDGKGLGVFYWEPQCYNWASYGKGAWSANGRPTVAMDAFIGYGSITPTSTSTPVPTYTQRPTATEPKPTPTTLIYAN